MGGSAGPIIAPGGDDGPGYGSVDALTLITSPGHAFRLRACAEVFFYLKIVLNSLGSAVRNIFDSVLNPGKRRRENRKFAIFIINLVLGF